MKKIAIAGGHLSPALAVIQELKKQDKWEIYFFGRKYAFSEHKGASFEYKTVKKLGIFFKDIAPVRVKFGISIFYFFASLLRAVKVLAQIKPDLVLSFGGYVSFPVNIAAWMLKIPIVIHEQTVYPGFANKFFAKLADKILISWQETEEFFPREKTVFTGNPIRRELLTVKKETDLVKSKEELPLVYITGGATGAHSLNTAVEKILSPLLEKYRIIHQCGDSHFQDYERIKEKLPILPDKLKKRYYLVKNLDSEAVAAVMKAADIIIGRSGANTIVEAAVLAKPAIFIPLPWSAGKEQLKNAQKLKNNKTSLIIQQPDLNKNTLFNSIKKLLDNIKHYQKNADIFSQSEAIKKHTQAAGKIAGIINAYGRH